MWYPSPTVTTGVRRAGRVAPSGLRSLMARGLGWRVGCSHRGPGRHRPKQPQLCPHSLPGQPPGPAPPPHLSFPPSVLPAVLPSVLPGWRKPVGLPMLLFPSPPLHGPRLAHCSANCQPSGTSQPEQGSLGPGDVDLGAAAVDRVANWGATVGPSSSDTSGLPTCILGGAPCPSPERGENPITVRGPQN